VDLPEVRQLTDPESPHYGAIATPGQGAMAGQWFIGNGLSGGGWGDDSQVDLEKGWEVLQRPAPAAKKRGSKRVQSRS
jgi:hypothetical protein